MIFSRRDIMALSMVPGVGPKSVRDIINYAKTSGIKNFKDKECLEKVFGRASKRINDIIVSDKRPEFLKEINFLDKNKRIKVLTLLDDIYPPMLKNIYDPPSVIYYDGQIQQKDENAVAIVGSRRCSVYGMSMAEKLAFCLAERGVTVISGMARGIDTAAHRGALRAGGRTIAVMGSGFKHIYPDDSGKIVSSIAEQGAVITEYSSDIRPLKGNFPRRNRIISGMAKAVIVVEAARKSGAMITARYALEQGREVMAVPGRADSIKSSGTHFLIQNGAKLITCVEDVLEEISLSCFDEQKKNLSTKRFLPAKTCSENGSNAEEKIIVDLLRKEKNMHIDEISKNSGILDNSLPETLLKMEVKGIVKVLAGKNYVLSGDKVKESAAWSK